MTTNINPNKITDTPPQGQCWVFDEANSVPIADRNRIPALCGEECRGAWVRMLGIGTTSKGCGATANLGEAGADAFCGLSVAHEGEHSDGEFSWSWEANTATGVISLNVLPKGLIA